MGNWIKGLIILGIIALIGQFFTPWGAKAHSKNMGESVRSALAANDFSGIDVDMEGNVAMLSGTASSEENKRAAISTAENATCEKCADREAGDRWHEVNGENLSVMKVVPTVRPYTLNGVRTAEGGVVLNGHAPSEEARDNILADAEALFPGNVTDNKIKIALGAPNADWRNVAQANLAGLARLDSGEFAMNNETSRLWGMVNSDEDYDAANSAVAALPAGYNGSADISFPEVSTEGTAEIKSATQCEQLFENLKGDNKINFAYGRAEIRDPASLALLQRLADAAGRCASFRISVEGHTDADGSEAYNLDLSRRRAEEVVRLLVGYGVNGENISGGGYGETRPVASNDTPEGMAKNRRIEFKVTRSK